MRLRRRSTCSSSAASRPQAPSPRALPITRQGIAKHLAVLERSGLVMSRRAGREVRFAVRQERLDQARRRMAQVAARWDERLVAIKRIAEGG